MVSTFHGVLVVALFLLPGDVWSVNVEEEYHEESSSVRSSNGADSSGEASRGTGRDAPVIAREHYGEDHPVNRSAPTPDATS